ncbi:MAG: hypothetical protein ACR2I7_05650 [Geodermatophilaceae bacterium]
MPCGAGQTPDPHHDADHHCEDEAQEDLPEVAPWLIAFRRDLAEHKGGTHDQRRGYHPEQGRQEGHKTS